MTIQATDDFNTTGVAIPVGAVFSFAGSSNPNGWLLCQGQAVLRSAYPQLFAVISTTYNTQVDPTTGGNWGDPGVSYFRIPDYRGLFLKSVGTASGVDTITLGGYQTQQTKVNNLSINGIGNHGHSTDTGIRFGGNGAASGSVYGSLGPIEPATPYPVIAVGDYAADRWAVNNDFSYAGDHTHSVYGDNETRPVNKGTQYIIKF